MSAACLSAVDLHRMLASGANLSAETARVEAESLRAVVNSQSTEIAFLKAQLAMTEAAQVGAQRKKAAAAARQQAKDEHDKLSRELADTYQVDWKKAAFCPLTGQISALSVSDDNSGEELADRGGNG